MVRFVGLCGLVAGMLYAQASLEVVAAYYGADRSFLDVTTTVQEQAQPDGLGLVVGSDSLGGDPFPGQLKSLRVYYKLNGQLQSGEWKDGENVLVGRLNTNRRDTGIRGSNRGRGGIATGATLTIARAIYGAGSRTIDVTSLLRSMVQRDALQLDVPGTLLGDPAPGNVKELVVSYVWAGRTREARVRDGERLQLPVEGTPTTATPTPAATGLKIVSAQYGLGGRMADVTALLTSKVSGDRLSVPVDNNSMGGDPFQGADKVLTVAFEWNGQRYSTAAKEGQTMRLPPEQLLAATQAQAPAQPQIPTNGACFYPATNFQGAPACAPLGQDQPTVSGTFGSVRFFGSVRRLELFESANFGGRSLLLTTDLADLTQATTGFFRTPATWAPNLRSFRLGQ